jgi:HPt (histidine-containing phosphotransfer) domain-containing protein
VSLSQDPHQTPTPKVPELSAIDPEAINNLRELNPGDGGEFLKEIIGIYIEDTPKRIADLKSSMAAGDVALFTRSAHTIKGSSANVGAFVLKGVAERMESLSRREGLKGMPTLVADCEAEFARAAEELRKITA